ncbi:hypothetical protein GCM10007320_09170 [Pseudorhodoferax aquiterrae]|uniref:Uncharacterized protein n=1 Tax=Pseudorhodoferax aquiterrae TaxID=747304 RepID=A0ABQ3FX66_9BURK|nr:hypothetical protein [Pseudorhodoferax aquiterrae]GHC72937.1 hypothetical protein GCM10007320_09170 [Pseudorhodoferax aquiterrae]
MTRKTHHQLTREALEYAASLLENDDFFGIWPDETADTEAAEMRLQKAHEAAVKRIRTLSARRSNITRHTP